jgi:uncharacterized integral membrane protein
MTPGERNQQTTARWVVFGQNEIASDGAAAPAVFTEGVIMSELGRPKEKKPRPGWRSWVIIILLVLLLIFAVQNLQTVKVSYFGWSFDVWVWLLVVVPFALGVLMGGLVRRGVRKLRKPAPDEGKSER